MIGLLKKIYHAVFAAWFVAAGMRPWARGYNFYKQKMLKKVLSGSFDVNKLPAGYGFRVDDRIVEYPWLFSRLPEGRGNLLDAGSVLNYEFIISNSKMASKKVFISTLAPESLCYWKNGVSYIYEDLRGTCYKDEYFDWVVCLSTLEHVGMDNSLYTEDASKRERATADYIVVLRELRRVLKKGGVLYLSVPFGKYVNHGWFQVFDGAMVDRMIEEFSPASFVETYFKYEPDGWKKASREECKEAESFDMLSGRGKGTDFAPASRANVCLEMVKQ